MHPRHRPRAATLLLGGLAMLALLVGCAAAEPDQDSGLPPEDDLDTYFAAVASYDPDALSEAADLAAPGSDAEAYVRYLHAFADAALDGGNPLGGERMQSRGGVEFRACGGSGDDEDCVTWADLEGEDGALATFTVNDADVDDLLVEGGTVRPGALAEVRPLFAYTSPQSGRLFVLAEVSAAEQAVDLQVSTASYVDADGVETAAVETPGPTRVGVGETVTALLAFPEAALGGAASLVLTSGSVEEMVTLDVPEAD